MRLRSSRRRTRHRSFRFERLEHRLAMDGALPMVVAEGEGGVPLADFSLADVNPASTTYQQNVSPRDYLDQTTAWYFGHAT